ncbi:MAG TPA: succinate dehydrogenase cytochrome b subunit [Candidatus Limnocylindrales bacterium]|nr:succinate dehydrogenase cytochrome b subunit [Candidatus Limnocylindrales bacterium]
MKRILTLLGSTIGQKVLMGATGLLMIAFLIAHMAANLLVLFDAQGYNEYSHKLITNPLIYLAEFGLVVLFVAHFVTGFRLTKENRDARPDGYHLKQPVGPPSRKSLASSTMILTGVVLLVFVPLHLKTFKFGHWYETADGAMRDLHKLVIEVFQSPGYTAWYLIALPLLGFHAWHGFGSAFESMGVSYKRQLRMAGQALAVILTAGFMAVPVWVFFYGGGQ